METMKITRLLEIVIFIGALFLLPQVTIGIQGKLTRNEETIAIKDSRIKTQQDYKTGNTINNPIVGEGDIIFQAVWDETIDTEKPPTVSFKKKGGKTHYFSLLVWLITEVPNDTYVGHFYIPPNNQEYHGTHTVSLANFFDIAGNQSDANPETEKKEPYISHQLYIFIPNLAYVSDSVIFLLNIKEKESLKICPGFHPQFLPDGESLVFVGKSPTDDYDIWQMNLDGTGIKNLTNDPRNEWDFRISGDKKQIFFERRMGKYPGMLDNDIWALEIEGGTQTNLTNTPEIYEFIGDVSCSGEKIVYTQEDAEGTESIWIMNNDGGNKTKLTEGLEISKVRFAPSGRIFYSQRVKEGKFNKEIFSMNQDGSDKQRLTTTPNNWELIDDFSPDGTKVLLTSKIKDDLGNDVNTDQYLMNTDGTKLVNLTRYTPTSFDGYGQFLEDETIIFLSDRKKGRENYDIWMMYSDGTNKTRLTNSPYSNKQIIVRPKSNIKVGNLKGCLKGSVIEGGLIEILKDGQVLRSDMTNSFGSFTIENIPIESYTLKASADGYRTCFTNVLIEENKTTILKLHLIKIGERGGVIGSGDSGDIYIQNADGTIRRRLITETAESTEKHPSLSYAGEYLVYSSDKGGDDEIWIMDIWNKRTVQLTDNTSSDDYPSFSPCGKKIVFASNRTGDWDIWMMNRDGSEQINITNSPKFDETDPEFSPDGKSILFVRLFPDDSEIFIMNRDNKDQKQLTDNDVDDIEPTFSPGQELIAYVSNGTICTMRFNESEKQEIIKGRFPQFSPDGESLAFVQSNILYTLTKAKVTYKSSKQINPDGTMNIIFTPILPNPLDPKVAKLTEIKEGIESISCWGVGTVKNQPPVAITTGPYQSHKGSAVTLDGSGSYDPDGYIVDYRWYCDDELYSTYGSVTTWEDDYWGTITLEVTDNDGAQSKTQTTIDVISKSDFGSIIGLLIGILFVLIP